MTTIQDRLPKHLGFWIAGAAVVALIAGAPEPGSAEAEKPSCCWSVFEESMRGEVYEPDRWRELGIGTFFTEGWDEAWAGGPNGDGGAPRQGWLNAYDGVFYRLFLFTFNWAHENSSDDYAGGYTLYSPVNRRFQVRWDVPFVLSTHGSPGVDREYSFGDLQVVPRFLLAETTNVTHSLDMGFRTPTGSERTGTQFGAFSPVYNFWWNAAGGLVLRGGIGGFVPFQDGRSDAFNANLAAGYYSTPHDLLPIGDLVPYVSVNLNQLTDGSPSDTTTVIVTPGFRTHLGLDWYLLGGVDLPVTSPEPFDYQVLGALMKVF